MVIAAPAGISSRGSSRGANVRRAGAFTAEIRYCSATSPYSSQTLREPANACTANRTETPAWALLPASTSLRRSTASTSGPPSSPAASDGTAAASPTPPTAAEEWVSV